MRTSENQTPAKTETNGLGNFSRTDGVLRLTSAVTVPSILRARAADGGHEVRVVGPHHMELVLPMGEPVVFSSKRQLLLALTGGVDRHWTFERYFRVGRHQPTAQEALPAFDLLAEWGVDALPTPSKPIVTPKVCRPRRGGTGAPKAKGRQALVTVVPESVNAVAMALAVVGQVEGDEPELGIDLVGRADEVAKLLFAGFGQWIFGSRYDPDDVLQEVYKGLLARNRGKCPWDARKSSFGHYVHMVCRGVLSNYHRKVKRRREFETSGVLGYGVDGEYGKQDVASSQTLPAAPTVYAEASGMAEAQAALTVWLGASPKAHTQDGKMAIRILPMVRDGHTRAEIADRLEVSRASVSRGLTYLREQSKLWSAADV